MEEFKYSILILIIFSLIIFIPLNVSAHTLVGNNTKATLSLLPAGGTYSTNDNFTVDIYVNTAGQNVVAVAAYLNYDKNNFEAISIDFSGSSFTNTFEKTIDAIKGKIKIAQAKPTPGVNSAKGLVAKINFKAISPTTSTSDNFTFDFTAGLTTDSNIILDDGKGTDILGGVYNERFVINQSTKNKAPVIINSTSTPKAPVTTEKKDDLVSEALTVYNYNKFISLNQNNTQLYLKVTGKAKNLNDRTKFNIAYFIQVGTQSTGRLGTGERATTLESFNATFNKLPQTLKDWQDVIKIANGHWPSQSSLITENQAKNSFRKIYQRQPSRDNNNDTNAIMIAAYGLRPVSRNLVSEKFAIITFKHIYGRNPTKPTDWNLVRTIAYSGAKK